MVWYSHLFQNVGFGWALIQHNWCPYKERREHREAHGNGPVKEGAETGVKLPQAKECLQLPDLEEPRMDSFLETCLSWKANRPKADMSVLS